MYREMLLEMLEDELIDENVIIMACLKAMTDEQIKAMMVANDFFVPDADEDEDTNIYCEVNPYQY